MLNKAPNRNWKQNLYVVWFGCFLTGAAFSLIMPFLPLYVEQMGITDHRELSLWTGAVFSITFLFSAIAAPFWGKLSDRKGRKLMLLRSALGMGIVMLLIGFAQNIWQLLFLRALLGLLGGFIPNANALIATQVPVKRSGWALGTLSTGAVSGALIGPLIGGFLADQTGLRPVFFITSAVLIICFFVTLFYVRENFTPVSRKDALNTKQVFATINNPRLIICLFFTTMCIQIAAGSVNPVITLYIRELGGQKENLAFISGLIASVPGLAALITAPRLGKLSDRIGPEKVLLAMLGLSVFVILPMAWVTHYWQLGALRFLLGAVNSAMLPAVQTLIIYHISHQIAGRIFSYNQALRDVGNVTGPLMGAWVAAQFGFSSVFYFTAAVVLFNLFYSWWCIKFHNQQKN